MSRRQSIRLLDSAPTITPWRLGQIVRRDEGEHYEIGRVSKVISRNEYHVTWKDGTVEKNQSYDEISDLVQYNDNTINLMIAQQKEKKQEVEQEVLAVNEEVADGLVVEDNSNHTVSDEEEQEQVNLEQEQQEPAEEEVLAAVEEVVVQAEDGLLDEDNHSNHSTASDEVEQDEDLPGSNVYRNVNTSIADESFTFHDTQESDSSVEDHGDDVVKKDDAVKDDEAPLSPGIKDLINTMEALGLATPCPVCRGRRVHHCFFCSR